MTNILRASLVAAIIAALFPLPDSFGKEPDRSGRLTGTVIASATRQPVPGAVVTIPGTKLGASTDTAGHFTIDGIPVGTYTARVACVGFRASTSTDIVISTGHPVQLSVELEEEPIELTDDVTVTGSLFTRPREIVVNRYAMSYEEIRRAPGAIGDISRVMSGMPGIVPTSDQRNDLVVRGGSPAENLTIVDNVEIPNLSHFGAQGATGGPISMLNTEFVREASFLAGGFPAMYSNRLSSVLNVGLREGNCGNLSGMFDLGFSGAGLIMEGGIGGLALASGQAAITYAIQTIAEAGENIVSASTLYGGTYNLFAHTFPQQGIEVRFADPRDPASFAKLIDARTKAVFCESIGNPLGNVTDIAALAKVAHDHGVPLIVDNTVPSP